MSSMITSYMYYPTSQTRACKVRSQYADTAIYAVAPLLDKHSNHLSELLI